MKVEGLRLQKLKPPAQSYQADSFKAHLPQPSILGSLPRNDNGDLTSTPNQEIRNQMESTKTSRNQDQDLEDSLRTLFSVSEKDQDNLTLITEAKDDTGIKRYQFAPEYAKLLEQAMLLITNSLNNYWKAAPRFSSLDGVPNMTWSFLSLFIEAGPCI